MISNVRGDLNTLRPAVVLDLIARVVSTSALDVCLTGWWWLTH